MRTHSSSYTDYFRLIELAGFPTCYPDEIEWMSGRTYICSLLNGEYAREFPRRNCRMIHWQLERWREGQQCDPRFDETWVSDRHYNTLLQGSRYVTLGTDPRLASGSELPKRFDFIHLSYLTYRRRVVIERMEQLGFTFGPCGWGQARHRSLVESKAMLALHQDDVPTIEPLRYALAAAYRLPILAEVSVDYFPFEVAREDSVVSWMPLRWLQPKDPHALGYQFKDCVLAAL